MSDPDEQAISAAEYRRDHGHPEDERRAADRYEHTIYGEHL